MIPSPESEYINKTFSVLLTNLFILICTALSGILVARYLGASGKGILALIFMIATILKLIGGLGVEYANVYFTSKNNADLGRIFTNNIIVWLLSSIILVVVSITLRQIVLRYFLPNLNSMYFTYAILIFPFLLWLSFAQSIFQGLEKFHQYNFLKSSPMILKIIMLIFFVIILKFNMRGGIWALVLSCIFPAFFSFILLIRRVYPTFPVNVKYFKANLTYGMKGQIGLFFQYFNYRFDIFVVNYFLGLSAVGFYTISVAIAEVLWHFPNSIAATLFPRVAGRDKLSANEFTCRVARNSISIMLLGAVLLAFVGAIVIPIVYGTEFSISIVPLHLLLPGVIAFGLVKILAGHLQGLGKPQYGSIVTVCSLILTLFLDFLLIPKMGINGAALATTIAYTFSFFLITIFFTRITNLPLKAFLLPDFRIIGYFLKRFLSNEKKNTIP